MLELHLRGYAGLTGYAFCQSNMLLHYFFGMLRVVQICGCLSALPSNAFHAFRDLQLVETFQCAECTVVAKSVTKFNFF